eukprot:COSAG06_NODE_17620_length_930_cov_1.125150_1_plen_114_part_10
MVELMRIRATGDAVAVKHIAVDDKNDRDQTIQEVESMWRLNHPNIGAPLAGTLRFARAVLTRDSLPCAGWQCCSTARTCRVAYMSPERLHVDDRVGYGFAADVWAAGLIAGECA